jgi:hypothetical protein
MKQDDKSKAWRAVTESEEVNNFLTAQGELKPEYQLSPWTPREDKDVLTKNYFRMSPTGNNALKEYRAAAKYDTKRADTFAIKIPIFDRDKNFDFEKFGVFAIYGRAGMGKSLFIEDLTSANRSPLWTIGEREGSSGPSMPECLSRALHEMMTYKSEDPTMFNPHLVALDSIAFLSVRGLMGSGLASGGISRDPIAFLNLLQAIFRTQRKIALIIINPLGDPDESYLTGLQGGTSGVMSFGRKPEDSGAPNGPNHALVHTVHVMKPGNMRKQENVRIALKRVKE